MTRYSKFNTTWLLLFSGITLFLIFCRCVPDLWIMDFLKTDPSFRQDENMIFFNIMVEGNYNSLKKVAVFYPIVFVLGLSAVSFPDKPAVVVRCRSRNEFITRNVRTMLLYTVVFVFLLESVNILFAFLMFSDNLVINSGLILYSLFDFVTLFLFYLRSGLLLLVASILFKKNLAPFIVAVVYFLEFFASFFSPSISGWWMPFQDAVSITQLLAGEIQPADTLLAIIRGVAMDAGILWCSYFLFKKKEMIVHEKK